LRPICFPVVLPSFVRRPDLLGGDVAFVLRGTWWFQHTLSRMQCPRPPFKGLCCWCRLKIKNREVWQGSIPSSRVVAPSPRLIPLFACHVFILLWRLMPPFVVCRLPVGTLCSPRLSRRHHLLYNPGPIAIVRISCRLCVGRYLLGGGDVGFRSGGGGGGGALVWRRRAERRLADHDVLRALCGSMEWSRALSGNRPSRSSGNGFAERVVDAVVCSAPRKIFVALLNAQQSRLCLDRLRLQV